MCQVNVLAALAGAQEWRVDVVGSEPEVLREPQPLREERGSMRGIVLEARYFPLEGHQPDRMKVDSVIDSVLSALGNLVWRSFPAI